MTTHSDASGSSALDDVLARIDQDRVVQIARDLVDIPSPTGYEQECAEYILDRYREMGMQATAQEMEEGRLNAIGRLRGTGDGVSLMLNGHMDTSYVGNERYLPDVASYQPKSYIDGDWIYGLGIYNMKGGLAAFLHAAEAVIGAGVDLPGDLVIACVAGEIEKAPVDRYQGQLYRGGGCGTTYAVTHGVLADVAVCGEPTGNAILEAHGGYVWTKITIVAPPAHTVFADPSKNSIRKMLDIAAALEEWGEDYEVRRGYRDMPARVTLSAIEGGWPFRCSRVPIFCTLYVDTRLMPHQNPIQVEREIRTVLEKVRANDPDLAELHLESEVFMSQHGSEMSSDAFIFGAMERAHETVHGVAPERIRTATASDAAALNKYGIPALNYGPSGRARAKGDDPYTWDPSQGEHCSISDLYDCTRAYASLILDVCSRSRSELSYVAT